MTMLRRLAWKIAKHIGPLRAWAWNDQFRRGLAYPKSPIIVDLVRTLAHGGAVVELACGDGSLCEAVGHCYSSWRGIDISAEAVRIANARNLPQATFTTGDIADWSGKASLVIIEEALYYLPSANRRQLLERCEGTVIVAVHDRAKHANTLADCRSVRTVEKELCVGERCYLVLAPVA